MNSNSHARLRVAALISLMVNAVVFGSADSGLNDAGAGPARLLLDPRDYRGQLRRVGAAVMVHRSIDDDALHPCPPGSLIRRQVAGGNDLPDVAPLIRAKQARSAQ